MPELLLLDELPEDLYDLLGVVDLEGVYREGDVERVFWNLFLLIYVGLDDLVVFDRVLKYGFELDLLNSFLLLGLS